MIKKNKFFEKGYKDNSTQKKNKNWWNQNP